MKERKILLPWWGINFVFGFPAGSFLGIILCQNGLREWLANVDFTYSFVLGSGLLLGAVATWKVDPLKIGGRYTRFVTPEDLEHKDFGRISTIVVGVVGAGMMIFPVMIRIGS